MRVPIKQISKASYLIYISTFLCSINFICSQNINFKQIPTELGLSQNLISAIHEDSQGFIWVGTKDGLNRFDGKEFIVYQHDPFDSTSISGSYIKAIFEDSNGRLWVGTTQGLNLFSRSTKSFLKLDTDSRCLTTKRSILKNSNNLSHKDISYITEDYEGNIFVGTMHGGVNKIEISNSAKDLKNINITVFHENGKDGLYQNNVRKICIDNIGNIWVLNNFLLNKIIRKKNGTYQIQKIDWDKDFNPNWKTYDNAYFQEYHKGIVREEKKFHSIFLGPNKNLWIKVAGGFARWDNSKQTFKFFNLDIDFSEYEIAPLKGANGAAFINNKGHIWITGLGALIVYDTLSHKIIARKHNEEKPKFGLPNIGHNKMIIDRTENIWIGSNGYGLFKYNQGALKFNNEETAIVGNQSIRSIIETTDGSVWLSYPNLRLMRWDRDLKAVEPIILDNKELGHLYKENVDYILAMAEDKKGNLWLAGDRGLFKLVLKQKKVIDWKYFEIHQEDRESKRSSVLDIYIDKNDQIWLMTQYEFGIFNEGTKTFEGTNYVSVYNGNRLEVNLPCIEQESKNTFWLGTNEGLLRYHHLTKTFDHFSTNPQNNNSISHNVVKSLFFENQDNDKILWIGTGGGGLNKFNLTTNKITHLKKKDGLCDNVIYGILKDNENNLWLSTNKGISQYNTDNNFIKNYDVTNGLQDNEFNSNAYFKNTRGEMYFGGIKGLNVFKPSTIKQSQFEPNLVITKLTVLDEISQTKEYSGIELENTIELKHFNKVFTFNFCALDLTEPSKNQYAFRLKGFKNEWREVGNEMSATFTNIAPGQYTFEVKGSNFDGIWSPNIARIDITILPPWWKTNWAYGIFSLIALSFIFVVYKFFLNRNSLKEEAIRIQEIDALKSKLYTNISHEFRTPLTIIMGITDQLKESFWDSKQNKNSQEYFNERMEIINRNSKNLLRLINQMLELSKLDSGKLEIKLVYENIISHIQFITESFYSIAKLKQINLVFYSEIMTLYMHFDKWKIQHIITNLLSNAIKFTPNEGKVIVHISKDIFNNKQNLIIKISDNGIGIPKEKQKHIFDRFYQVDLSTTRENDGTGIGLSLVKELTQLMDGKIEVNSEPNSGTTFKINLPIINKNNTSYTKNNKAENTIIKTNQIHKIDTGLIEHMQNTSSVETTIDNDKPIVLIVEDNLEVQSFLKDILLVKYNCIVANDGEIGIAKAQQIIPDIIICDIMMPKQDGYALTKAIKENPLTNHIPIILLTAKVSENDKLKGLKIGADAYLKKPFSKDELFIRIEKLLELRETLKQKYINEQKLDSIVHEKKNSFMYNLNKIIQENLKRENIDASFLAEKLNISKSQLYRKLNAISDDSPSIIIRKQRLQHSKTLLINTDNNISQIAYDVGFNDPNYYTRVFHKEFGFSPTTYRKKHK